MPKKKAIPEPTPELETEPVPAAEIVEDPSAASDGTAEDAAALTDGDAAVVPMEEGASQPDDPVPVPEGLPADGQDAALEQETGGAMEMDAGDETAPEILGLEPSPSPDDADETDEEVPMPEDPAGMSWPDAAGETPADIPEWEQSPFPDPGQALGGTVSGADDISSPAEDLDVSPADGPEGVEVPAHGEAGDEPESVPTEERAGTADGGPPVAAEHGGRDDAAEPEPAPRRRTARRTRRTAAASEEASGPSVAETPRANSPQPEAAEGNDRRSFYDLDFNALDRGLSPEQRQEWNSIYASYRGRSVLTGAIAGVDRHSVRIRDRRTGEMVRQDMYCATVIPFRVRILIPSTEMWMQGEERPDYVLRNMSGAVIDFVVTHVDREAGFAIASRRLALRTRRYYFSTQPSMNRAGARLKCHVLAVGPRRCLVECGGYDIDLTQREMRYTAIPDLREQYHRGDALDCIVKEYDKESGKLVISVKETNPNPFDGAELRHPEGSRRQAEIAGKYAGGVFCNLPDGVVVMCSYSFHYDDASFAIGDKVIVMIQRYDFNKKQIYGKIVAKW